MLHLIDSDKAKPGKRFSVTLTADAVEDGRVIVPRGSTIIGHVTEVKKYKSAPKGASLRVVFDAIKVRHGKTLRFTGVLAALTVDDDGPFSFTKMEQIGTSTVPITQQVPDADDVAAFYRYIYDEDAGDGITILCRKQDIHLGWDNRMTIRVAGPQPKPAP